MSFWVFHEYALVVLGFNATLTAKVISWQPVTHIFPGFLTPVLTLFFPKPHTTFPTCFCRGERRKYTEKKGRLNRGSNSQPPGHESDTLTTEPPLGNWYETLGIPGQESAKQRKDEEYGTYSILFYFQHTTKYRESSPSCVRRVSG